MDFIGTMEGSEIQVELKYCERCGGLWLRPRGWAGVHCASCHARLAVVPGPCDAPPNMPSRRKARPPAAPRRERKASVSARIDRLQGVATMEVRL